MSKTHYIIGGIAIILIVLYLTRNQIKAAVSRAYSNNNPGNIRPDGKTWIGEKPTSTDPGFKQFVSMPYGYRAIFVNLKGYLANGLNTIQKIISTWAPQSDGNNTQSYIDAVVKATGKTATTPLVFTDSATIQKIAQAISQQESGIPPNMDDLNEGFKLLTA